MQQKRSVCVLALGGQTHFHMSDVYMCVCVCVCVCGTHLRRGRRCLASCVSHTYKDVSLQRPNHTMPTARPRRPVHCRTLCACPDDLVWGYGCECRLLDVTLQGQCATKVHAPNLQGTRQEMPLVCARALVLCRYVICALSCAVFRTLHA